MAMSKTQSVLNPQTKSDRNDHVLLGVASLAHLEGKSHTVQEALLKTEYLHFSYLLSHEVDQTIPSPRMGFLPFRTGLVKRLGKDAVNAPVSEIANDASISPVLDTARTLIAERRNYDLTALSVAAWLTHKAAGRSQMDISPIFGDLVENESFMNTVGKHAAVIQQKGVGAAIESALITKLHANLSDMEVAKAFKGRYGLVEDPETGIVTLMPSQPAEKPAADASKYNEAFAYASTPRMDWSIHTPVVVERVKETPTQNVVDFISLNAGGMPRPDMSPSGEFVLKAREPATLHSGMPRPDMKIPTQTQPAIVQQRNDPARVVTETPYKHAGSYGIS